MSCSAVAMRRRGRARTALAGAATIALVAIVCPRAGADAVAVRAGGAAAAGRHRAYRGVEPGKANAPAPKHWHGRALVTWIGFKQRPDGSSRVFLQLVRDVDYKQAVVGGALWVTVAGVRLASRNTARPLDVRYFHTSLARITTRRTRRHRATARRPALPNGIALVITFKHHGAVRTADASLHKAQDGYYYLYLDFPAGGGEEQAATKADKD